MGFWPPSPPGHTIEDILETRGISLSEFGHKIGLSYIEVHKLLVGDLEITKVLAQKLEKSFQASSFFWMKRETIYREDLIKCNWNAPSERQIPIPSSLRDMFPNHSALFLREEKIDSVVCTGYTICYKLGENWEKVQTTLGVSSLSSLIENLCVLADRFQNLGFSEGVSMMEFIRKKGIT